MRERAWHIQGAVSVAGREGASSEADMKTERHTGATLQKALCTRRRSLDFVLRGNREPLKTLFLLLIFFFSRLIKSLTSIHNLKLG